MTDRATLPPGFYRQNPDGSAEPVIRGADGRVDFEKGQIYFLTDSGGGGGGALHQAAKGGGGGNTIPRRPNLGGGGGRS
ncbi:MAG: hypothetical protein V4659_03845 [Pseudomonadota bacterium]